MRLRFLTITGELYRGDIAVDNFHLIIPPKVTAATGVVRFLAGNTVYSHETTVGDPVRNVLVHIRPRDGGSTLTSVTGIDGVFSALSATGTVDIEPEVQSSFAREGLGDDDVIIIQNHILGNAVITDTLIRLAADVNRDGTIDVLDMSQLRSMVLGNINSFPDAPTWQLIPDYYLRNATTTFHPDPVFSADFWNTGLRNAAGEEFPFTANMNLPGRTLDYAQPDDWVGQLASWELDAGAAELCRPSADFILFKTGDTNRSANPHGFPTPSTDQRTSGEDTVAETVGGGKSLPPDLIRLTDRKERYHVSVFATSDTPIMGFQTASRYDPEVLEVRRVHPNRSDLYQGNGRDFSDIGGPEDPVVRTIWVAPEGRARRFARDAASPDDVSGGKLLFRLDVEGYVEIETAAAAIREAADDLPTAFHDTLGRPIEGVDFEIYVTPRSGNGQGLDNNPTERPMDGILANGLRVFPNPVSQTLQFTLVGESAAATDLRLVAQTGRVALERSLPGGEGVLHAVPVADLQPGVYYLEVRNSGTVLGQARVLVVR